MSACAFDVCDGSGFVIGDDDTARPCRCRDLRIARNRSRGLKAVIPPRYADVSFDRPPVLGMPPGPVSKAQAFCRDIRGNLDAGRGLMLYGDVGTGKTTLAMLVSRAALEAQRSVAIYSAPRLVNAIRRTYDDSATMTDEDLIERLISVDLLHIDDLGAEHTNEWVVEQLYAIVNGRYEAERSLVVTANVKPGSGGEPADVDVQLREHLGERTASRLKEMCTPVPMFGTDARRGKVELSVDGSPIDHDYVAELNRRSGRATAGPPR